MINQRNVAAIIPARGGSKGIPKKNVKNLVGKPLIAYTIEEAKKSRHIDKIFVSTDSDEIAEISRKYGAEIINRTKELAKDDSLMVDVIKHAVEDIKKKQDYDCDIIVILQPTSPLRTVSQIEGCIEKICKTNCESVTTVSRIRHNPFTMVVLKDDKTKYFISKPSVTIRQKLPKIYRIDSAVHVITKEALMKQKDYIVTEDNKAVVIPNENAFDIDDMLDFHTVEKLIRDKKSI